MRNRSRNQRGITLLEAMVAILVAALGVLGILGSQLRALADSQGSVRRTQAIRLIEDLSERMRANPKARAWLIGKAGAGDIVADWSVNRTKPSLQCGAQNACNAEQLADYEMEHWLYSVNQLMPGGNARVFLAHDGIADNKERNQLGVLIAWRENEKDVSQEYKGPIDVVEKDRDARDQAASCPRGSTCHLQYIALPMRCYPLNDDADPPLLCPDIQ